MSTKLFYTGIDLQQNELQNAVIHPLASAPSNPIEGQIYYNTGDNTVYVYNGTAWDAVGTADLSIAEDSQAFLSIVDGELHFSNLAITEVHVDTTNATLADFIADSYTVGNEFQEGDVIILTSATDQGERTWIHNGGTAGTNADFTALTTTVSTSVIREAISGESGVSYNSTTGVISADVDNSTVQVGASGLEVKDSGISTAKIADNAVDKTKIAANVAGDGLAQNVDGSLEVSVDGTTLESVEGTLQVADGGISQSKLDATLEAKIVNGYAQTVGDGTSTSFTITHNLGTKDVMVMMYKVDTGECVTCQVARTSDNAISVGAFPAPASNNLRIMVQKLITA